MLTILNISWKAHDGRAGGSAWAQLELGQAGGSAWNPLELGQRGGSEQGDPLTELPAPSLDNM